MSSVVKPPMIEADRIEREINVRLSVAKLRLRFDKVALRFVGRLKTALANVVPEGQIVVFTICAPIRLPGKTAVALENMVRFGLSEAERHEIVHDNKIRIRRLSGPKPMPRVLGFVHSVESDAGAILALAEARLLELNGYK